MGYSPVELYQILLHQLHFDVFDKSLSDGEIEKVTIHTKSRRYAFILKYDHPIPAASYLQLYESMKEDFKAVARISLDLHIEGGQPQTEDYLLDYWPVLNHFVQNKMVKQVYQSQLPAFEDGKLILHAENEQVLSYMKTYVLDEIIQTYKKLGFEDVKMDVVVDEATALDRRSNFEARQEKIQKEQQEMAKKVAEQKEQRSKPEIGTTADIQIGKPIPANEELRPMNTYREEVRSATMEGVVFDVEVKELKTGRRILNVKISDYTSAFLVQMFSRNDQDIAVFNSIKKGMWLRVQGDIRMDDRFARDLVLNAKGLMQIKKEGRKDTSEEKRIELHLHTKMSTLDATNSISDFAHQAKLWGHEAIAITDHAGVQGFPEASKAAKKEGLKLIYGLEANVVDDGIPIAYNDQAVDLEEATYVIFDVETTGLSAVYDSIIELSAVKMQKANVIDTFSEFINPGKSLSQFTTQLTSITDEMLANAQPEEKTIRSFKEWTKDTIIVAHNATFDIGFINAAYRKYGIEEVDNPIIDTLEFARFLYPEFKSYRLNTLAKHFGVNLEQHHRAIYDAESTGALNWIFVKEAIKNHDIHLHNQLNQSEGTGEAYKKGRPFHATLLAKNQEGLKDLFKLVSASNVEYFYRVPRIPRSLLSAHRENLLIGSGDVEGEVWEAAMQKGYEVARQKAEFYDYLELQPMGIYRPLFERSLVHNQEDLQGIIKNLLKIGEELNKPVVVTGDVHYLNPEDKIYREILINSDKSRHITSFPEAHFRTTNELLDDYAFLGEEKAKEIVIQNTHVISDQIAFVEPIHDKLYTPHIDGAEESIREDSYNRAKEIYGDPLPDLIEARLEKELGSIIGNGFSVIYYIAQRLVKKSNEDGYIVGSRGSVGSSFVATMLGITEVNPLAPHYVCPNPECKYSEFFTEGEYGSGFDLADKNCPKCGTLMNKDGHEIPFETFLGFHGDKVPDIDLNFSGEYQAQAHNYTKVLFGEDHVYKAGTISTVADKTAFGYVLGYGRDTGIDFRNAEKEFLAQGSSGVKRTTGQHPGGIIVIPENMDVYDFTPVQYPADDQSADWKTTHFDFHSIHDNVLKLDCLGHDDPTVIRKLQDLSGIEPTDIPMDDPEVYALFNGTESLKVSPEQILSKTGTLGIPEFGTPFVRQLLEATHPNSFAELLQISGLSHGTDVWLGNAEVLIRERGLKLKEVIGCRDDIMMDLIHYGVPSSDAFRIMEEVRHGRGLTAEDRELMASYNVPEWYMWSCDKIKYMFPKAHAAAYVINALRVAWYKVHHPLWYYCAYLSVRAYDFDLTAMAGGLASTKARLKEIKHKGNDASKKEQDVEIILELVNEMWERGFKFKMVDLEKSQAESFVIEGDDTLIAPFRAIPGLGASVARQIVKAREESPFLSKEDLKLRGKVSQTTIDFMSANHVLDRLPDENQLSLF